MHRTCIFKSAYIASLLLLRKSAAYWHIAAITVGLELSDLDK